MTDASGIVPATLQGGANPTLLGHLVEMAHRCLTYWDKNLTFGDNGTDFLVDARVRPPIPAASMHRTDIVYVHKQLDRLEPQT